MLRVAHSLVALLAAVAILAPERAAANPRVNTQIFRMAPHPGDLFNVLASDVPESKYWSVSGTLIYGSNPLVFVDRTTDDALRHEVIQDQLTLDLTGSVSLGGWVDLGVAVPVFLVNQGDEEGFATLAGIDTGAIQSAGIGDVRVSPKIRLLQRAEESDGFGLALDLLTVLPTGDSDSFVSDGFSFQPGVIGDFKLGPVLVAGNLGWRVRSEEELPFVTVDDEFYWRLGTELRVLGEPEVGALIPNRDVRVAAIGEMYGSTAEFGEPNNLSFEGIVGAKVRLLDSGVNLHAGGGTGFVDGYGNTKVRLFLGAGYSPPVERDRDGDGILDADDACPTDPEDMDGFEDEDGCPDPDNDGDGILDVDDECPNDPEDADGFEDSDGCPDPDNDGDGIPDDEDECPLQPEDMDGFEDDDGCPDPDNDGDGIPDDEDECPLEPETRNNFEDDDGCPDEAKITLTKSAIELHEKVYFDFNKATIKRVSYGVLDAVAGILEEYPEIERVRIEGHTDHVGDAGYNKKLSQARAEAVRDYLIDKGISADRMEAVGYGESRPAVEGRDKAARDANRRVEMTILEQRPIKRTIDRGAEEE
ncbi:MAG: OmpA family protein [Myxococcota bacterium]